MMKSSFVHHGVSHFFVRNTVASGLDSDSSQFLRGIIAARLEHVGVAKIQASRVNRNPLRIRTNVINCYFVRENDVNSDVSSLRTALRVSKVWTFSDRREISALIGIVAGKNGLVNVSMKHQRASRLGADTVRIIGGHAAPSTESRARCRAAFKTLAMEAFVRGVRVRTENWFPLLCNPAELNDCFRALQGAVGLTFDFGNWGGDDKYIHLEAIAEHAEGCHAKCSYDGDIPDEADFEACIRLLKGNGYSGTFTLVHAPGESVWDALAYQRSVIERIYSEA